MGIRRERYKSGNTYLRLSITIEKKRYQIQYKDTKEGMQEAKKELERLLTMQKDIKEQRKKEGFKLIKKGMRKDPTNRISSLFIYPAISKNKVTKYVRIQANPMVNGKIIFSMTKIVKSEPDIVNFINSYAFRLPGYIQAVPDSLIKEYIKKFRIIDKEVRQYNESISKKR